VVQLYIGNTDNEWFDFLRGRPELIEANFWRPSAQPFAAVKPGELFVFRLKSPRNRVGGFGVLSSSTVLPLQVAWETFGMANGVPNYVSLRDAIARYRANEVVGPATNIGCRVLVETVFLEPDQWFPLPESWSPNIVSGKGFSTDEAEGLALWQRLGSLGGVMPFSGFGEAPARFGAPHLITPRLGQGAFRVAVTEAYQRSCALTEGKVLPALDAAHIVPYGEGGPHIKSNGVLLRKDIHSVFDAGYATIDTDHRFVVSDKVREVFNNGEEYRRLQGKQLRLPTSVSERPDPQFLRWHNENRFLG
jgi:putative restriction endonuclease